MRGSLFATLPTVTHAEYTVDINFNGITYFIHVKTKSIKIRTSKTFKIFICIKYIVQIHIIQPGLPLIKPGHHLYKSGLQKYFSFHLIRKVNVFNV